jgi:hypothetical protein
VTSPTRSDLTSGGRGGRYAAPTPGYQPHCLLVEIASISVTYADESKRTKSDTGGNNHRIFSVCVNRPLLMNKQQVLFPRLLYSSRIMFAARKVAVISMTFRNLSRRRKSRAPIISRTAKPVMTKFETCSETGADYHASLARHRKAAAKTASNNA